jgi:Xaa-Pro aminopeptidase
MMVDAGAEVAGYAADISRTWPVSGKFSAPQSELYETVLEAQQVCIDACYPGANLVQLRRLALQTMHTRLQSLVGI